MGDKRREVPAECLFADTVADIAVLGEPDNQKFLDEAAAYDALVGHVKPYRLDEIFLRAELYKLPSKETIFDLPKGECGGWLLALDGHWFRCDLVVRPASVNIENAAEPIVGGMSGSPIVMDAIWGRDRDCLHLGCP